MENMSIFELLQAFEDHETAIQALYEECARSFPEYHDFWETIAAEEAQHARWIKALRMKVADRTLIACEGTARIEAVHTAIKYIRAQTARVKSRRLTAVNAFSIAMSIEEGILEKNFFKVFDAQTEPYKTAMRRLTEATTAHRDTMRSQLQKLKAQH
jgi:hypothetical protein